MTVTDPDLKPETLFNPNSGHLGSWWAKYLRDPFDVMVDIDDVIFPTMMSIHDLAREAGYHNGDVEPSWTGWEVYKISEQAYWDLWSDFALSGGYLNTEPIPEALEALRRLYFEGHRIHLVTARGFMNHASDIRAWTPQWIEEFGVPWHSLTFARDKVEAQRQILGQPCPEHGGKFIEGVCDGLSWGTFDYAIDDSPRNVEALRRVGVKAYLLDHVHNKSHEYDQRVASVGDFVDMILREAE